MKKLAILSTHPIQYNAPLFRLLQKDDSIELQVFFSKTWNQVKYDPDFQREIVWDIPVSEGYPNATYDASFKTGRASLEEAIRSFKPDALLVYGWNFPGHLAMMRIFHGSIPIWFRGDSHLLDPMPVWKKIMRQTWLKWVYRHIDLAFTVGSANEAYFEWCGLKPDQMTRAPHAVDIAFFGKDDSSRQREAVRWREALGIEPSDVVVLYAGKLEPKKQPDFLLQAWHELSNPRCHILVVGSGPQESYLHRKWSDISNVHFLGFQNQQNMPIIYRMADVFCLPSAGPGETWGLSINEALASGIPCIVSDRAGCAQDIFPSNDYGIVVKWNDKVAWINAIQASLTTNRERINWPTAIQRFSFGAFIQAIEAQLSKLES